VISIIMPTLNEEQSLPRLLDVLRGEKADHEVIVVDGGSEDRTAEIARARGVRVVLAPPGRGNQLCVGGQVSRGDILFFLHADSTLPVGALTAIEEVLASNARVIGGNFRLVFDGNTGFSRWLTDFYARIRWFGLYYGDSGIFVRRGAYEAVGGFRPIPLMEDLDFVRRLERFGKTCRIDQPPLVTSSRRFLGRHPVEIVYGWVKLHVLFWLGVSPSRLAEIYRTHTPRGSRSDTRHAVERRMPNRPHAKLPEAYARALAPGRWPRCDSLPKDELAASGEPIEPEEVSWSSTPVAPRSEEAESATRPPSDRPR